MKKLIILLQLLTVGILHAQPDSLWSHTYGGLSREGCSSLIQTRDGGFALAGYQYISDQRDDGYLVKTDARARLNGNERMPRMTTGSQMSGRKLSRPATEVTL
ncbi:MAG: hypothetical protein P9X24_13910 [Candidatus Hatepunaea meridiana]|nr:hypothetical protein [Candidatus Hatepunaea meridiana]